MRAVLRFLAILSAGWVLSTLTLVCAERLLRRQEVRRRATVQAPPAGALQGDAPASPTGEGAEDPPPVLAPVEASPRATAAIIEPVAAKKSDRRPTGEPSQVSTRH